MLQTLVRAAAEAYRRQPQLPGYRAYPVFWGSTQSYVFVNGETLIVAFRGTQPTSVWDWGKVATGGCIWWGTASEGRLHRPSWPSWR
jgi:hypothetical protein